MRAPIPTIFVAIPVLNEEQPLGALLARLNAMPEIARVVVCDGGSVDKTVEIARENGALVAFATPNRGAQMNAGVAVLNQAGAIGGNAILWFLHADSWPHVRSGQSLARAARRAIRGRKIIGGNFQMRFDDRQRAARIFAGIGRVQRRLGIYYGDSGMWMRADVFRELGGFQTWPLFEDYDLARRLEKFARENYARTICLRPPLVASARRFRRSPFRALALWASLQILFWLGVSPRALAKLYHR